MSKDKFVVICMFVVPTSCIAKSRFIYVPISLNDTMKAATIKTLTAVNDTLIKHFSDKKCINIRDNDIIESGASKIFHEDNVDMRIKYWRRLNELTIFDDIETVVPRLNDEKDRIKGITAYYYM